MLQRSSVLANILCFYIGVETPTEQPGLWSAGGDREYKACGEQMSASLV